jgi:phage tail-like protein
MSAKVKNPRKSFNWSITFPKHPISSYLAQKVTLPDVEVEQVSHGDTNHDIKTAGRVSVGNLTMEKLCTTSGSDTWLHDWLMSCQDIALGGGNIPSVYKETCVVCELAEDGESILNTYLLDGVWPCKVSGNELDRNSSDNIIEKAEFSVDTIDKY